MTKQEVQNLIEVATGRKPGDFVIKNVQVVDVYQGKLTTGDVAICGGYIAGVGDYAAPVEVDGTGKFLSPGFIDSHIHIESSYVSPEELGKMLVPCGGTTIIADPHEIVNVCGIPGLDYMMEAAKHTALDIKFVLPSCVPATPFEHNGAIVDAKAMAEPITREGILGLGEFMNFPGIVGNAESEINKVMVAKDHGKSIDGHYVGVLGKDLNAYASVGILTDHECSTVAEMEAKLSCGIYVLLRQGSACHDLRTLAKGVTRDNSRRCLLCSDDRQPKTMLEVGHLNNHLAICVEEGIDPITAIRMATLNAAECFGLSDRGAIAPGKRADLVLLSDLETFTPEKVWVSGDLVAEGGNYLPEIQKHPIDTVQGSCNIGDFSQEKLQLSLSQNRVHVMELVEGGVLTKKKVAEIQLDESGDFVFDRKVDISKVAVVERHHNTGNVAVGFLAGYGIQAGAVALSVAHDSHNFIVVGTNNPDMAFAVETLKTMGGGIVLVKDGQVVESMAMPIAGLMSNQSGAWVRDKLTEIHEKAHEVLGIGGEVEPVMTLCFMSLAVIPELKLTDVGLFDVTKFDFIPLEAPHEP